MKKCTQCGRILPITDFYWRDKAKGLRRSECKYCHNNHVKMKYQERHAAVEKIKAERGCAKCGDKRPWVLDFHHLNPEEKDDTIAIMLKHNVPMEKLQTEIDKCIVLCSNCHREFHYFEKKDGITIEQYLADWCNSSTNAFEAGGEGA